MITGCAWAKCRSEPDISPCIRPLSSAIVRLDKGILRWDTSSWVYLEVDSSRITWTFEMSWNMYFLNYPWYSWSHGRHLVKSSITLCLKSSSLLTVYAFICPKLLMRSWDSKNFLRAITPRLLMTTPKASCLLCALDDMWWLNAVHRIFEASTVDCSSWDIEYSEHAVTVSIGR